MTERWGGGDFRLARIFFLFPRGVWIFLRPCTNISFEIFALREFFCPPSTFLVVDPLPEVSFIQINFVSCGELESEYHNGTYHLILYRDDDLQLISDNKSKHVWGAVPIKCLLQRKVHFFFLVGKEISMKIHPFLGFAPPRNYIFLRHCWLTVDFDYIFVLPFIFYLISWVIFV